MLCFRLVDRRFRRSPGTLADEAAQGIRGESTLVCQGRLVEPARPASTWIALARLLGRSSAAIRESFDCLSCGYVLPNSFKQFLLVDPNRRLFDYLRQFVAIAGKEVF